MEELRNIVKDSLREAFYSKKDEAKVVLSPDEEPIEKSPTKYIGLVDGWDSVHAKKLDKGEAKLHNIQFHGVSGDRWRYSDEDKKIIWTSHPSDDAMYAVETFLEKNDETPKSHFLGLFSKLRDVDAFEITETILLREINMPNLSDTSKQILQESLHSYFRGVVRELNEWMSD
jgi:hypothetical protein